MTGSKDSKNDELLTMMEEMQDEIESLRSENGSLQIRLDQELSNRKEIDSEAQQMISDLSSAVSMLKRKVQDQKQEIVDLSEKNARLNKSDLQLKEAKRLKDQAEEEMRRASTLASVADSRKKELDDREQAIYEKENKLDKIEKNLTDKVERRVNYEVSIVEDRLEKEYWKRERALKEDCRNSKRRFYEAFISVSALSILGTIITALISETFKNELKEFFISIWGSIESLALHQESIGMSFAGDICGISSSDASYEVVTGIVIIVQMLFVLAILIAFGVFLFVNIKEYLIDELSLAVLIISTAITVYGAPALVQIPVNMFTLNAVIIAAYMTIRFYYEWDYEETKKKLLFWILWISGSILAISGLASMGK